MIHLLSLHSARDDAICRYCSNEEWISKLMIFVGELADKRLVEIKAMFSKRAISGKNLSDFESLHFVHVNRHI